MRVASKWRGWAPRVATILLLAPIVPASILAARLTVASWTVGGMLPDPIVRRITGIPPETSETRLARAAVSAPLDFRFPYRLGRAHWLRRDDPDGAAAVVRAQQLFGEAASLAPTYGPCRLHLFWTALALGETEMADREARAALELAPMHLDIRRRVSRYFLERYRATGDTEHLRAAFRGMAPGDDELALAFLDDPLLTYERFRTGAGESRLDDEEMLRLLRESDRWSWAIRYASELDADGNGSRRQGRERLRYAAYLLELGAVETAGEQVEAARRLLGGDFDGWSILGRTRMAAGRTEEALEALGRALGSGASAADVGEVMSAAGVEPARRCSFWEVHAKDPRASSETRLELARCLLDSGRAADAERILRSLVEDSAAGPEAHYLLARLFLSSGHPRIALRHAREAARLVPGRRAYRELLDELTKGVR